MLACLLSSPVRKVFQQLQPRPGTFLWVELHCKDVVSRHRCRQVDTIMGAASHIGAAFGFGVVAVHKVEAVTVRNVVPERVVQRVVHLVPAHVGHFQAFAVFGEVVAEVADFRREQADAFHTAVFFAAGHQGLHTNANAEERSVLGDFFNELNHAQTVHFGHAVADAAYTGQNHPVSFTDFGGIVCNQYGAVRGHVLYGFASGMQVAHTVVDAGDGLHGVSVPIGDRLQGAFGGRGDARHALVHFNRHAQCAAEGFEHGFDLVMGVLALQVVDVQGHHGVIHKALEELCEQVDVKPAHAGAGVGYVHEQTGAAGQVDDHA